VYAIFVYVVILIEKNSNSETGSFMLLKDHPMIGDIITWDIMKINKEDVDL
jgi:hypothetical protein